MARTVSNLPGPVASWIMGALAKGQRVYYFTDDPSGYVDSKPATDHLGRPVISEGEGNAGQQLYRNITKAETLPLYRITPLSLELPEKNNLYIFASAWTDPGIKYFSQRGMGQWVDGVDEDSAFYTSPTVKYRYMCVTPDNQVFPQGRITGFSSGQDKAIIAAVAVAVGGFWAYGGGGAAAGASATGAAAGAAGAEAAAGASVASVAEAAAGASVAEAAAGAAFVGPVAPGVAGGAGAGAGAGAGITMSGVAKGAAAAVGAVTQVAGAVTQVSAALNDSGGANTAPPPEPPADNTIYWMVGGAILVVGVIL